MDAFVKAETYEHHAYLTTARGNVYHLFFVGQHEPLIERLTPTQEDELNVLRRRYSGIGACA